MKKYIKSSLWGRSIEFNPEDGWTEEDIEFYNNIDWSKANSAGEYQDKSNVFIGEAVLYSTDRDPQYAKVEFVKTYRRNPVFPPYYRPIAKPFPEGLGPMYDGLKYNGYDIHDRYETQKVYDMLFD